MGNELEKPVIEQHFADKNVRWSRDVKANAGGRCKTYGCDIATFDAELRESHHIKPVSQFPQLRYALDNGECRCIYHHALQHTGSTRLLIMARGFLILLVRLFPNKKNEISRIRL